MNQPELIGALRAHFNTEIARREWLNGKMPLSHIERADGVFKLLNTVKSSAILDTAVTQTNRDALIFFLEWYLACVRETATSAIYFTSARRFESQLSTGTVVESCACSSGQLDRR